jgi:hypothetical protein
MYEDLRKLLYPGFLTHRVTVNGCPMAIRTLNKQDLFLLECRTDNDQGRDWQNWAIATSVWMIDGQICFGQPDIQYVVYQRIKGLPRSFREDLFSLFTALMSRVSHALTRMESFLYEEESRYLWVTEGAKMFDRPPFTGAPVVSPNLAQKTWISFNRYEDKRSERKYWWGLSKFIVQPHAPKGITKLNNSEKKDEEDEEERRQQVMDLAYWKYRGVVMDNSVKIPTRNELQGVFQAETVDDLHTEMANWVAGKKDFHDNAVDFVKAKIKSEVEARRQADRDRIDSIQNALEEEGMHEPAFTPLMGEAADAAARRMLTPKSAPKVYQDAEKHNTAYDKYIKNNPDVGSLEVDEKGNINTKGSAPRANQEQLLEMLTAPEDKKTGADPLQQRVSQRAAEQKGKN